MYAYVDRPVTALSDGGRFVLHAMRGWIQAASRSRCPPGFLAPMFARQGALAALPPLHRWMAALNVHALERVAFLPVCHALIGDDEAVLLQLWQDARFDAPRARQTLSMLVDIDEAAGAFDALLAASARLGEAGLGAVAIAADTVPGAR